MEAIIKIFAFLGFVVLLYYLILRIWDYYKKSGEKSRKSQIRPPLEYMNEIGIKCPDYWTYNGKDSSGNYQCLNSFDLQLKNNENDQCYSNSSQKMMIFKALQEGKDWNTMSEDEQKSFVKNEKANNKSRCEWASQCGAVWLGVNDKC